MRILVGPYLPTIQNCADADNLLSAPAGRQHTHQHAQGLRERGVGGVGRGLEGRELVLVARFFAPWVRAGGVGPYAWCGESPSSSFLLPPPHAARC
jgi:hypothetical protein